MLAPDGPQMSTRGAENLQHGVRWVAGGGDNAGPGPGDTGPHGVTVGLLGAADGGGWRAAAQRRFDRPRLNRQPAARGFPGHDDRVAGHAARGEVTHDLV
jgi:hypothetical protein